MLLRILVLWFACLSLFGCSGAEPSPEAEAVSAQLIVDRVFVVGQSVADGPAAGSPPAETPLAAVKMWVRDGTGIQEPPAGQNFDAFTVLQQPSPAGHGGELQCGVNLWKAGVTNMQIKIAKGATSIAMWSPVGQYYPWYQEEIPQILAASAAAYPGAKFRDHLVFNCGQYEATANVQDYALVHTYYIGQVRLGLEALLGKTFDSVHIELTQLTVSGGDAPWISTVRAQQLAVPGAYFINYDDQPTTDGTHPPASAQNVIGARRAASILEAIHMTALQSYSRTVAADHINNKAAHTPAATHYYHLYSDTACTVPLTSGNASGYVAKSMTNNKTTYAAAASRSVSNAVAITFATPTGTWPSVQGFKITDSATEGAGNVLAQDDIAAVPVSVALGPFSFGIGQMVVTFAPVTTAGGFADSVAHGVLDLLFGGTALTQLATTYLSHWAGDPNGAGVQAGSRAAMTQATVWGAASAGVSTSVAAVALTQQVTGTYLAIHDASVAGNLLYAAPRSNSLTGASGTFQAGQLRVALN